MTTKPHQITCKECDSQDFSTNYVEPIKSEMITLSLCFECNFWRDKVASRSLYTIIDGSCYCIRPDISPNDPYQFKGFGGRKHIIRFFDGRPTVITHNLWHQGSIPPHFRNRLQDEAEFIHHQDQEAQL